MVLRAAKTGAGRRRHCRNRRAALASAASPGVDRRVAVAARVFAIFRVAQSDLVPGCGGLRSRSGRATRALRVARRRAGGRRGGPCRRLASRCRFGQRQSGATSFRRRRSRRGGSGGTISPKPFANVRRAIPSRAFDPCAHRAEATRRRRPTFGLGVDRIGRRRQYGECGFVVGRSGNWAFDRRSHRRTTRANGSVCNAGRVARRRGIDAIATRASAAVFARTVGRLFPPANSDTWRSS